MCSGFKPGEKHIPDIGAARRLVTQMRYKMSYMKIQNKNSLLISILQNMRYKMS